MTPMGRPVLGLKGFQAYADGEGSGAYILDVRPHGVQRSLDSAEKLLGLGAEGCVS